jgi:hypothetical protein
MPCRAYIVHHRPSAQKSRSARQGSSTFRYPLKCFFLCMAVLPNDLSFAVDVSTAFARPARRRGHDDSPMAPCLPDQVSIHIARITHITHIIRKVGLPTHTRHALYCTTRTHACPVSPQRNLSPSLPLTSHPSNPASSARADRAAALRWSRKRWGGGCMPGFDSSYICAACTCQRVPVSCLETSIPMSVASIH